MHELGIKGSKVPIGFLLPKLIGGLDVVVGLGVMELEVFDEVVFDVLK